MENNVNIYVYKSVWGSVLKEVKSRWQFSGDELVAGFAIWWICCPREGGEGGFDGYWWRFSGVGHCLSIRAKTETWLLPVSVDKNLKKSSQKD